MKILKILGIAAGFHALALILIFANPGCSYTKAADPAPSSPITSAPTGDSSAPAGAAISPAPDVATIRYSPTRPGTVVASALETQPVSDVTPATTYTVVRGDSLSSIAKKNQLSKADLAAANKLRMSSVLHVGQKLVIPNKPSKVAGATAATVPAASSPVAEAPAAEKPSAESVKHVVKPGETLGGIARMYHIKAGEIAVANNITDPKKIQPGQELIIPAKAASERVAKGAKPKYDGSDAAPSVAAPQPAGSDQDLDAGLKPSSASDVPVVKIDDGTSGAQPKNP